MNKFSINGLLLFFLLSEYYDYFSWVYFTGFESEKKFKVHYNAEAGEYMQVQCEYNMISILSGMYMTFLGGNVFIEREFF